MKTTVVRCPNCGSTHAGVDESRSAYEFAYMQCSACAHGELQDEHQIKANWNVDVDLPEGAPLPERLRCLHCCSDDALCVWAAMRAVHLSTLVDESHFSIQLIACRCGQRFVKVFTERIDWQNGDDDQTWLVFAVLPAEAEQLQASSEAELHRRVTALGRGRRFLVHCNSGTWWQPNGFMIGPHD
jgi:hypothetical protein